MSKYSDEMRVMQSTFKSEDGMSALALILSKCGYFTTDPSKIKPDLIALANWLVYKIGITDKDYIGKYVVNMFTELPQPALIEIRDKENADNDRI